MKITEKLLKNLIKSSILEILKDATIDIRNTSMNRLFDSENECADDEEICLELETEEDQIKDLKRKKVGDYTALDGQYMLMKWPGIENKGKVQDIRMYDNDLFKGQKDFDTIALFRQQDNLEFFYARIVPVGEHETKWQEIDKNNVPQVILDDFETIDANYCVPCHTKCFDELTPL